MNRDKLDNELRSKLGDARVSPPSDMWDRIATTLQQEGLTAAGPVAKPTITIRRPRRMRLGYAAAAAVVLCALVFGLRQFGPELEGEFATEQDTPTSGLPIEIVVPEPTVDIIADATVGQERPRTIRALSQPTHTTETLWEMPTPVIEIPELIWEEESMTFAALTITEKISGSDVPRTEWADQDEIERMLKAATKAEKRTRSLSVGLYSSNIGNTSSEKVVNVSPVRAAVSDLTVTETTPGIYSSSATAGGPRVKLQHKMPLSMGLSVTMGITDRLSVESGATYTYMLSKGRTPLSTGGTFSKRQELHYVGIPLGVKYDIVQGGRVNLYAGAAGLFEMCVLSKLTKKGENEGRTSGSESERLNLRGILPSVGAHIGAEVKLANRFALYVEPGMNYYFETGEQPESYRKEHPLNFSLRAGFRVRLK